MVRGSRAGPLPASSAGSACLPDPAQLRGAKRYRLTQRRPAMAKIYTGIGSRQTPAEVLALMTRIAQALDAEGYILRSGEAAGADTAFAQGATRREIFLP